MLALELVEVGRTVDVTVVRDRKALPRREAMTARGTRETAAVVDQLVGLNHELVVQDRLTAATALASHEQPAHTPRRAACITGVIGALDPSVRGPRHSMILVHETKFTVGKWQVVVFTAGKRRGRWGNSTLGGIPQAVPD